MLCVISHPDFDHPNFLPDKLVEDADGIAQLFTEFGARMFLRQQGSNTPEEDGISIIPVEEL